MKSNKQTALGFFLLLPSILVFGIVHAEIIDEDTPVPPVGAMGGPDRELLPAELEQWIRGRLVFDRDWQLSEGLGTPELNADSCRSCHQGPVIGGAGGLDVNVMRFGFDNGGNGPFENLPGGPVASKLRRVDTPGREDSDPLADVFEQRQTPSTFGLGLIETIFESEILSHEDPNDVDGNGCRGVARMIDVGGGVMEIGILGWKAQVPSVSDFLRDALGGETGITVADDGRGFGALSDADGVPDPEISQDDFDDMLFYSSHLAAPPRGGSTDPMVSVGEAVFNSVGCAICHVPSMQGTEGPVNLYSDLLLHNIHPADFRGTSEGGGAGVGYYKTPPLWGVRVSAPYLHDGRAATLEQAIEMHTGEAELIRQGYDALSESDQEALRTFLSDL